MRISRFLILATLVTVVALGYVHQQIELLRINYTINRNKDNLSVLLDQNSILMYNLVSFQSPFYLEKMLAAKKVTFEIPSSWHTIASAEASEGSKK
ncbi:MAG: hypothetical protein NG712_00555 [Omnitrophica bacterium]|nr:hypothetical protein [Candidatus Omnitrophota bacterium]